MKSVRNIFVIVILFAAVIMSQRFYDAARAKVPQPSPFVPSANAIKAVDLGLDSAASSLYWLASIQYIGGVQSDNYQKMGEYIRLCNDLDPRFSHPYAFATLIMPALGQVDEAIAIGQKGIEQADPDWEIPYYTGITYHMEKGDSANAAKYFDIAGRTPGAPDNISWIAANYGSRPDLRDQTKMIWQGITENSNDPELQKRAEIYVYHFELMDFLEQAAAQYKTAYGKYPDPIGQLVEGKILKEIPADPFGYNFYIDESGRCRIRM